MTADRDAIEYVWYPDHQRDLDRAFSLLVSGESDDDKTAKIQKILGTMRADPEALDTLLVARQRHLVVGVTWGERQAGKTAVIWPARVVSDDFAYVGDELQRRLDEDLATRGVQMSQALLNDGSSDDAHRLLRCGYERAADLLFLMSGLRNAASDEPKGRLSFEAFRADQRQRLADVVERTYVGSMDIPAMDGMRDMADVLDGYEQTGEFSPDRWMFVQSEGRDVGCLLLADHPQLNQWELVYMGIVPEARGNRWGAIVTAHAQSLAKRAGRDRLVLAVDALNDPAIAAYSRAAFVEWFRRVVLLKKLAA